SDSGSESGNGQGAGQSGDAAEQEQKGNQDQFITAQKSSQVLASSLMGLSIQNGTGQDASEIGTVSDLIMDEQHKLVGIVVGIGGFLGIGQKSVGIPWEVVENLDPEKGVAVVSLSKEQLQNAPPFKSQQEQQQEQQQQQQQQPSSTGGGGAAGGGGATGGGAAGGGATGGGVGGGG